MKSKYLYNQKNKATLLKEINNEPFARITCSFYKYTKIAHIKALRNQLFLDLNKLKILGRIYLSNEGINAQISVPEFNIDQFKLLLTSNKKFKRISLKFAIQEGLSFLKLTIKVKKEIVAYKIKNDEYDMNKIGQHLESKEFNKAIDDGAIIVDMRNYYESEIGKFKNSIIPDVERSCDLLPEIKKILMNYKKDKILMYCTGGIRCEKASSYLLKNGFKDVNQLKGGIIQYAADVKNKKIKSKFIGKNFVFDHRINEQITDDIIATCHQCGALSDQHRNCNNQSCHILFIQCESCCEKYSGCCTVECKAFSLLSKKDQKKLFKSGQYKFTAQKSENIKPRLEQIKS